MNRSRRHLDPDRMDALLDAAGVPPGRVRSRTELTGGMFNTCYRVRLDDGSGLILKISPDPDAPILTYEQRIMRAEALFYRLARERAGAPVPEVVHAGFDQDLIDGDYMLMTEVPGRPWTELPDGLAGRDRLRFDLGKLVAALHRVTGNGFGYPSEAVASLSPSWRTAFGAMVEAVLADAERLGGSLLPWPPDELRERFQRRAEVLDDVRVPVLVHFDLWDGNILVDVDGSDVDGSDVDGSDVDGSDVDGSDVDGGAAPRIGGLIDGERVLWGDPVADFVSLALLGDIEEDRAFLAGYRAAGGQVTFDAPTRERLSLYCAYLYLIMLVEADPRGFDAARRQWLTDQVASRLTAELDGTAHATRR